MKRILCILLGISLLLGTVSFAWAEEDGEDDIEYSAEELAEMEAEEKEAEDDVAAVADALTAKGYKLLSAQVEMLPQNGYIKLTNEDDIKNMQKKLDMFEDNDDVQNDRHNWEDAE